MREGVRLCILVEEHVGETVGLKDKFLVVVAVVVLVLVVGMVVGEMEKALVKFPERLRVPFDLS